MLSKNELKVINSLRRCSLVKSSIKIKRNVKVK